MIDHSLSVEVSHTDWTVADGRWLNLGGNQAVGPGGNTPAAGNPYEDSDGGFAARTIVPGTNAEWLDDHAQDLYVLLSPFATLL